MTTAAKRAVVNEDLILYKLGDATTAERADELVEKLSAWKINWEATLEKFLKDSHGNWTGLKALLKSGKCKDDVCCQVKIDNKTMVEKAVLSNEWEFLDDCLEYKCMESVNMGNDAYKHVGNTATNIPHKTKKKLEYWDKKRLFLALMGSSDADEAKKIVGWMRNRDYILDGILLSVDVRLFLNCFFY